MENFALLASSIVKGIVKVSRFDFIEHKRPLRLILH